MRWPDVHYRPVYLQSTCIGIGNQLLFVLTDVICCIYGCERRSFIAKRVIN